MKKQSSILSIALSLFFFSVVIGSTAQSQKYKPSDVSVTRSISAGQYASDGKPMVVVTITIKKDAYRGPGRIEEDFSSDFQAVAISTNHASFQTSSGKAEFIWSNIQDDRAITVSYSLEALGKISENQTVTGQFYYQNQSFNIGSTSFTLDVSNLKAYSPVAAAVPSNLSTLDDLYYSVTGNYPPGVTPPPATPAAPAEQSPVVTNTTPAQQTTPPVTTTAPAQQSPAVMNTTPIQQTTPPITNTTPAQQTTPPVTTTTPAVTNTAPVQQSPAVTNTTQPEQSPIVTNITQPEQQQNSPSNAAPETNSSPGNVSNSSELVYRVQIIVVGDKSRLPRFFRRYRITEEPFYDPPNDTPVRVMIGNYTDYNSAKARCNELKNKGLKEAFVVSYYMGKRVAIGEAAAHTQHQ